MLIETKQLSHPILENKYIWLAAIIDGEGSISVGKTLAKNKNGKVYNLWSTEVRVYNTNQELMNFIHNNFGGRLYQRVGRNNRQKKSYTWFSNQSANKELLGKILPYLIAKDNQARLVLEFIETLMVASDGKKNRIPEAILSARNRIKDEIRNLNRKGPIAVIN